MIEKAVGVLKKTCRWHVFNADLGGYAAVAPIKFPPHHLRTIPQSRSARQPPLHKGAFGWCGASKILAFTDRADRVVRPYGWCRTRYVHCAAG